MPAGISERAIWPAVVRGAQCRCPSCGVGRLFNGYLKAAVKCEHCHQELEGHQADDAPPYFTIFIVGHIVVGWVLWLELAYEPPLWVHAAAWAPLTIGLSLALLRPIKGALIGYQWALRMHGFAEEKS